MSADTSIGAGTGDRPDDGDLGGEIALGSALFTLVDPHEGHEVAYNRWYERDHFYAGCMNGPFFFAGRRRLQQLHQLRHLLCGKRPGRNTLGGAFCYVFAISIKHIEIL